MHQLKSMKSDICTGQKQIKDGSGVIHDKISTDIRGTRAGKDKMKYHPGADYK
jgi:hypothetical protein